MLPSFVTSVVPVGSCLRKPVPGISTLLHYTRPTTCTVAIDRCNHIRVVLVGPRLQVDINACNGRGTNKLELNPRRVSISVKQH
jgi:hypothetical protein